MPITSMKRMTLNELNERLEEIERVNSKKIDWYLRQNRVRKTVHHSNIRVNQHSAASSTRSMCSHL